MTDTKRREFKKLQNGYTKEGQHCRYLAYVDGFGHLVEVAYEWHDGDEWLADHREQFVSDFLLEPPRQKFDVQIAQAKATLEKLFDEIDEAARKNAEAKQSYLKTLKSITNEKELKDIEKWLAGEIKYIVLTEPHSFQVIDLACPEDIKYLQNNENFSSKLSLISLCCEVDRNKKLHWGVNSYRDGSGCYRKSIFFSNLEDLRSDLVPIVETLVRGGRCYGLEKTVKKYNLPISEQASREIEKHRVGLLEKDKARKLKEKERLAAKISEIDRELAEPPK